MTLLSNRITVGSNNIITQSNSLKPGLLNLDCRCLLFDLAVLVNLKREGFAVGLFNKDEEGMSRSSPEWDILHRKPHCSFPP